MTGCLHISEEKHRPLVLPLLWTSFFPLFAEAVEKAKELRAQGISVSLIQMQEGRSKDDYLSYAMKDHVSKVEFIEEA